MEAVALLLLWGHHLVRSLILGIMLHRLGMALLVLWGLLLLNSFSVLSTPLPLDMVGVVVY